MGRRIYVASSWRNSYQQDIVTLLTGAGHEVYDFRNPPSGGHGFAWKEIDGGWESWSPSQYRDALKHPLAVAEFLQNFSGMEWADTCVLVLPAGRSASWELGWFAGQRKFCVVFIPEKVEPELMYGGAGQVPMAVSIEELLLLLAEELLPQPHDEGTRMCPRCQNDKMVWRVGDRFACGCCGTYTYNPVDDEIKCEGTCSDD